MINSKPLSRRTLLKGSGVLLSLPFLEAMVPSTYGKNKSQSDIQRLFVVHAHLGFYPDMFWPKETGSNYELSSSLKPLEKFKNKMTVVQGTSHPGVKGGHGAASRFLSGTPSDIGKNGVSFDQVAAEKLGVNTRYTSIEMGESQSINRSGVRLPSWGGQSKLFQRLFIHDSAQNIKKIEKKLQEDRSILDLVSDQTKSLQKTVGKYDKEKLDEYYSSVRHVEKQLQKAQDWAHKPPPVVPLKKMQDISAVNNYKAYFETWGELAKLALQTDMTRVLSWGIQMTKPITSLGFTKDWHGLTHTEKELWGKFDRLLFTEFAKTLSKFESTQDGTGNLLDNTSIIVTSPLGHAGKHTNKNLPALVFGGPYKHGQHLNFKPHDETPTANLYLSLLNGVGIQEDKFATSTGTLTGMV
ncbi:MAG: DUF1552 domain-containing protein [Lentisphaeraceae bacterium]|nr:DUF1552 domain-containing protein [Lentisphaeraceae bacterium]